MFGDSSPTAMIQPSHPSKRHSSIVGLNKLISGGGKQPVRRGESGMPLQLAQMNSSDVGSQLGGTISAEQDKRAGMDVTPSFEGAGASPPNKQIKPRR